MTRFEHQVTTKDLHKAVSARVLAGAARDRQRRVVWEDRGAEVLIHGDSFRLQMDGGWLVSAVDMEADQSPRQPVAATFFVGKHDGEQNLRAATPERLPAAGGLEKRWGAALQDATWAGVLETMDAHLARFEDGSAQEPLAEAWAKLRDSTIGRLPPTRPADPATRWRRVTHQVQAAATGAHALQGSTQAIAALATRTQALLDDAHTRIAATQRLESLSSITDRVHALQASTPALLEALSSRRLDSRQARALQHLRAGLEKLRRAIPTISDGADVTAVIRAVGEVATQARRLEKDQAVALAARTLPGALELASGLDDLHLFGSLTTQLGAFRAPELPLRSLARVQRDLGRLRADSQGASSISALTESVAALTDTLHKAQVVETGRQTDEALRRLDKAIEGYGNALKLDDLGANIGRLQAAVPQVARSKASLALRRALDDLQERTRALQSIKTLDAIMSQLARVEKLSQSLSLSNSRPASFTTRPTRPTHTTLPDVDPKGALRRALGAAQRWPTPGEGVARLASDLQRLSDQLASGSWQKREIVMTRALRPAHEAAQALVRLDDQWADLHRHLEALQPWLQDLVRPRPVALLGFHGTRDALVLTIQSGEKR